MSFTLSLLRFELVEIVESPLRCRVFCREPEKIVVDFTKSEFDLFYEREKM